MVPGVSFGSNFFFIFMQFLKKIGQNNRLVSRSLGLAPPPLGNPGSATAVNTFKRRKRNTDGYCVIGTTKEVIKKLFVSDNAVAFMFAFGKCE